MKNPITKPNEKLDNGIMYFMNKSVKVWNYTTCGTRADSAKTFFAVGSALESKWSLQTKDREIIG